MRGGCPKVFISEMGIPRRGRVRQHKFYNHNRLTVITLGIVWSWYMIRNLALRCKRVHRSQGPRVGVIGERIECSI